MISFELIGKVKQEFVRFERGLDPRIATFRVYVQETSISVDETGKTVSEIHRIPLTVTECSDYHYRGLDIVNEGARDRFSPSGNKTCIEGLDQVSLTGLKNSDF